MTSTVESHQRGWAARLLPFLASLPALICGAVTVAVLAAAKQDFSPAMASLYQGRAERAFAAGDYRTARLCFERLALEDGRPEFIYALSRSCWALGEKERAAALLARIAPVGRRRTATSPLTCGKPDSCCPESSNRRCRDEPLKTTCGAFWPAIRILWKHTPCSAG